MAVSDGVCCEAGLVGAGLTGGGTWSARKINNEGNY